MHQRRGPGLSIRETTRATARGLSCPQLSALSKRTRRSRPGSQRIVGWSPCSSAGDGGVDGVINEDRLGLEGVYIQAKLYAKGNAVGRPEVQSFRGESGRTRSDKGRFRDHVDVQPPGAGFC
jgi:hypothetical protein